MKKINLTIFTSFLILAFFSCKRQGSMKEYIEKGFSKPTIGDGNIVEFKSVGNGGKVYVPSEKEIEVQFAITNKYSIEITGKIEIPEDKKAFFSKEPEIKELTPTKMVIAFNFKGDAEPKAVNQFLGESVGMTLKIFDKKTGRFLSSQVLTANCNTPPEKIDTITYNSEDDKYTVVLPKNSAGVHNDLKKVEFTLSSAGNDEKKTFTIDIEDASQQGQTIDLPVKGNGERQLKNPSGQRKIEVTVYDKAGLKSDESKNETQRIFTSITLLPHEKSVSVKKAKEGFPIPEIKELKDFFDGDDWKKAGYTVEYSVSNPVGFVYDEENKVLKHPNPKITSNTDPAYTIKVILKQGTLHPPVDATFTIKIVDDKNVDIDIDNLTITDITDYPEGKPPLSFEGRISFLDDASGVLTADVQVSYTSFNTKLKVQVQAVVEECKGKDEGASAYWSPHQYKTEYIKEIGNTPDNERQDIKFSITSADGSVTQKYRISLVRQEAQRVKIEFDKGALPNGKTAKVVASWTYKSEEFSFTTGEESEKIITVGKNQNVKFDITVGEGVKIESCETTISGSQFISETGGEIELTAFMDFTLTIKLRGEASLVDWEDCRKIPHGDSICGYDKGTITYIKPNASAPETDELNQGDTKRAVKSGTSVKLKVEGLHTITHYVAHWVVNDKDAADEPSKFALNADKTELTILNAQGNYEVKITVRHNPLTLTASIDNNQAGNEHGYTLKATDITAEDGSVSNIDPAGTTNGKTTYRWYSLRKVKIEVIPPAGGKAKYGVKEWQKLKDDGSTWETIPNSKNKTFIELIMDNNKEVKAVLAPQYTFTLSPKLDANKGKLIITKNASDTQNLATINMDDQEKSKTITHDGSLYFKVEDLGTDNLVVSYKRKGFDGTEQEMASLFDTDTGMWKEKGSFNIDPGDEFVVEIARVQRIRFSVSENGSHYAGSYGLDISRIITNDDAMLFPKFSNDTVTLNSTKIGSAPEQQYSIYITKNTQLRINAYDLNDKEIAEWKNGNKTLGTDFNDDHDKPASIIGKTDVTYEHNGIDYGDFNLKAIIRDKTYLLTVEIKDYYREHKDFKDVSDNGDVDMKIIKSIDGQVVAVLNKDRNEYKRRFKAGEKIRLNAKMKGDKYRFAFWEASGIDLTDQQEYSYNLEDNQLTLPNDDVKITGFYTKHLIVVMHKRNDGGESNDLPSSVFTGTGNTKYGKTKVIAYNGSSQKMAECTVNNNQDHIQKFKRTVNLAFNEEFFLIKEMSSLSNDENQAKYIELHFEKPDGSSMDKKIIWKYNLANYLPYPNKPDTTAQGGDIGKPRYIEDNKTKVKFTSVEDLKNSPILHLWLHKVE